MRSLALFPALLLAGLAWAADEKPKINTLTPKEISEGWLLLFDGETTFGWKIEGEAKVEDGCLVLGGKKATRAVPTTRFGNCEVSLDYSCQGKKPATFESLSGATADLRFTETGTFEHDVKTMTTDGTLTTLAFEVPEGTQLRLRNYRLRPKNLTEIFNGKDLTGWKEHPGKKSKFTVADNMITVKDGPGDLQTEGQYADFILQLECISNGDKLNSGVFFRAIPGEYQQGYEAQVHNGFTEQPMKEYEIEDYDPKTHEKIGSRKEKYTAIDYGTGAIYRRQPARKQMSKDNEWFGMTVVAQGRHLAVWVNGVMVTDWTDNRPESKNARQGCKLEKGAISLQGHDPTTNLSFRNFRIAELGKKD